MPSSEIRAAIRRAKVMSVVSVVLLAAVLFLSSGRRAWGGAWAWLLLAAGGSAMALRLLVRRDPELVAERARMRAGVKGWDRVLAPSMMASPLVTCLVAGLDVRFGWSPAPAWQEQVAAFIAALLGFLLTLWAMLSNRFFSSVVRIQSERGHVVATGGPYATVRHPGYVGMIVFNLATPVILGSDWALIPGGLTAAVTVLRAALEDRTLQRELKGYAAYAARVRYRLVPGVW